jgi:prepilin-type N-terminal cleavage/methylation domain-containing protein
MNGHVRTRRGAGGRLGFTLVEVLVSIALIAVLAAIVSTMLWTIDTRRVEILRVSEANRTATALIDSVERQATATFVATRSGEPGVSGRSSSLTLRSRASAMTLNDEGGAELSVARSPLRALVTTSMSLRGEELRAGRGPGVEEPERLPMPGGFERLRFRYHDGERWRSSFDSARVGRLPVAIEIAVWFAPSDRVPPLEDDMLGGVPFESDIDDPIPSMFRGEGLGDGATMPGEAMAERSPDRLRVIVIPDAAEQAAGAGGDDAFMPGLGGGAIR